MKKLVVIDGNSILNRAFYGIMATRMLQTSDGTYTNAVYGFLAAMFKIMDAENPEYMAVAFDLSAPTKRHELYSDYKGTRKGMPNELAVQLPIVKQILEAMNICVIEKQGYEADDILGTLSVWGAKQKLDVILLTGDRDSFQLAKEHVTIRIPRTKQGKTEEEDYDYKKIVQTYGVTPKQLIEVKGLMGDKSDNIPGVPGIGEKTALNLIKKYGNIDKLYEAIEAGDPFIKGKQKEKIIENKELAYLSKTLGTIDTDAPIEKALDILEVKEWNKEEVLNIFKELRFKRFIDRFELTEVGVAPEKAKEKREFFKLEEKADLSTVMKLVKEKNILYYYFELEDGDGLIINKKIKKIYIYIQQKETVYVVAPNDNFLREIFENNKILKSGFDIKNDYIILKQNNINPENMMFDAKIAMYIINSITNLYTLEELANYYLGINLDEEFGTNNENVQTSLFDLQNDDDKANLRYASYAYVLGQTKEILENKMEEANELELFKKIEMPCAEVLAEMKFEGVLVDKEDIKKMSKKFKEEIQEISSEIYDIAGQTFNINSPKQLGEILFEKLKLPVKKKNKNGYATDVETLKKLTNEHPIIEKVLYYRQISKLNSTFVEGMLAFINPKTNRIHTSFHQTATATGRLSSSNPNLQNIPTRKELGKQIRKLFKAEEGRVYIDADYSQIELRVLAHLSKDKNMIEAFKEHSDIHKICASQVFGVPIEEVTKEMRTHAKAVNFGIVYGISDFGLSSQLGISKKEAKEYIDAYLSKYESINQFMENEVEKAKKVGFVETMFGRRRYIPEISSNNYMVRKFGDRAAMNTPVQGTAADIMKIAMINVYKELKKQNLKSKIVLQIHDELIIEAVEEEKEKVSDLLKNCMQNAAKLAVDLEVDLETGKNWYETK